MPERIPVPLDGSKVGEAALPYVGDLVSKMSPRVKVEVTLLHVASTSILHHYVVGPVGADILFTEVEMEQIKEKAMDYLNKAGEALKNKGATVTARVVSGNATDEIIKASDEINADLVAMSTHGRSGLSRWAFGSVTERVLRAGNHPVLVVRAQRAAEKAT